MKGNQKVRSGWPLGRLFSLALSLATIVTLSACDDDPAGPGSVPTERAVSLSFGVSGGGAPAAPSLFAGELVLGDGANTLVITSAEMVLREIEFERVEDNACDDDLVDDDCEKFEIGPQLIALPLDGSISQEIVVQVDPGNYDEIEFDVHKLESGDPAAADLLAARPEFDNISVRVEGTYNDVSFVYTSDLDEEQEIELTSPLVITAETTTVNATFEIDLDSWFRTVDGTLIDPTTGNKGEEFEEMVKDNIRFSIEGFRDDDRDGVSHDDDPDESDS